MKRVQARAESVLILSSDTYTIISRNVSINSCSNISLMYDGTAGGGGSGRWVSGKMGGGDILLKFNNSTSTVNVSGLLVTFFCAHMRTFCAHTHMRAKKRRNSNKNTRPTQEAMLLKPKQQRLDADRGWR